MKQALKRLLFGTQRQPRRIPFGLYRGLTLAIDPAGDLAYYFGMYERETYPWLRGAIAACRSFVDIGAGGGEMVAWALAHPTIERVIACEASEGRWALFQSNMALNGFAADPRLKTVCAEFLSAATARDDMQALEDLPAPILLKIDIDGGEEHVVRQLEGFLRRKNVFLLIETHSRELDAACMQVVGEAGYKGARIPQAAYRRLWPEHRPIEFNQWITASRSKQA